MIYLLMMTCTIILLIICYMTTKAGPQIRAKVDLRRQNMHDTLAENIEPYPYTVVSLRILTT